MTLCAAPQPPFVSGEMPECGELLRPGGMALTERAIALAGWKAGNRVVDIGCGRGAALKILQAHDIDATGVDPACRGPAEGVGNTVVIVAASAETLPFQDGCINGILSECSLSLIGDKRAALTEFARVLKPQGRLVITDLYARLPLDEPAPLPCLEGLMERDEIKALVISAGFDLVAWEDHSNALTELVGRVLFEYGSLDVLWGGQAGETASSAANSWMMRHRPGYMLVMAVKKGDGPYHG